MNCRFAICIPVYNNPGTVVQVIKKTLEESPFPVILVDDGSDQDVKTQFVSSHPELAPRVTFVRHPENQGKGIALQTGFQTALSQGFTHLVTIDADGQHDPAEIAKLVEASERSPFALVVGDREMRTENVPGSSTFGKKFSNFWIRYQTDVGVGDSQSGFRVYPLFHVQNMSFFSRKYDFEVEILTRLIWKGVQVRNVKVSVVYFPREKRVSHFHKVKDNVRITILNTFLVIGSLLRERTSPFQSSLALAVGVFIGCLPLYGLHAGIAALLAFLGRLNFIYLFIGTQISIPPMVPFLVIASSYLGSFFLLETHSSHTGFVSSWAVGSVLLGLLLGLLTFALSYGLRLWKARKERAKTAWTGRNRNHVGAFFVLGLMKVAGLRLTYAFLYFVAAYYSVFSWRLRRSFTEFWKVVRPEAGFFRRQILIFEQTLVFAKTLVDRGLQRQSESLYFDYELDESVRNCLEDLREDRRGMVMVASHVGGWELAIAFFAQLPVTKRMLAVMYGNNEQFTHTSVGEAQSRKAQIMYFNNEESTILKLKAHLSARQAIGMMGDRPVTSRCELLPFFGKLALFDTTPFRIAIACETDLYFVFALKEGLKKYKIYTFQPVLNEELSREEKIQEVLRQYVGFMEKTVREYPTQWFNFFPFWSKAPEFWS